MILTVTDGLHITEVDVDIVITDVNNGPPTFPQTQYTGTVSESASVGAFITTVTASDPDADTSPYGKLVYKLTANTNNKFNIDQDLGHITVAGELDAEESSIYNLVVHAAEQGGANTATVTCMVTIEDENDNYPTCTHLAFSITVPESTTTPANLQTLSCSDKDSTSTLQYSISSGDTSLFQMNHTVLQLIADIDYDTIQNDVYEVSILVSDGLNSIQVSGVVTITGDNEATPVFNPG